MQLQAGASCNVDYIDLFDANRTIAVNFIFDKRPYTSQNFLAGRITSIFKKTYAQFDELFDNSKSVDAKIDHPVEIVLVEDGRHGSERKAVADTEMPVINGTPSLLIPDLTINGSIIRDERSLRQFTDVAIFQLGLKQSTYKRLDRSSERFKKNKGKVMVSDLLLWNRDRLQSLPLITETIVDEIIERIKDLLSPKNDKNVASIASSIVEHETSFEATLHDDTAATEASLEAAMLLASFNAYYAGQNADKKSLIDGFHVVDGIIFDDGSSQPIADASITALDLSECAHRVLVDNKPYFLHNSDDIKVVDLFRLSRDDLNGLPHISLSIADEIVEKITRYLSQTKGKHECYPSETIVQDLHVPDRDPDVAELAASFIELVDSQTSTNQYLVPGVRVVDGVMYDEASSFPILDAPISALNLSMRASNVLNRNRRNITMHESEINVSDLVQMQEKQLTQWRNLGISTLKEIKTSVQKYLHSHVDTSQSFNHFQEPIIMMFDYAVVAGTITHTQTESIVEDVPIEALGLSARATSALKQAGIETLSSIITHSNHKSLSRKCLSVDVFEEIRNGTNDYLDNHQIKKTIIEFKRYAARKEEILTYFRENYIQWVSTSELLAAMPSVHDIDTNKLVEDLVASGQVVEDDGGYRLFYPSFRKVVSELGQDNDVGLDERTILVIKSRAVGKTLNEISQTIGVTRERVRQIERKTLSLLIKAYGPFEADQYKYLFKEYDLDKNFYLNFLQINAYDLYYLNYRYHRGQKDPLLALDDQMLPKRVRRSIDKYVHRGYLLIEGKYIPLQRAAIENIVVEMHAKQEVTIEQFFDFYSQFLINHDLTDKRLQLDESVKRTRANRLADSSVLLWKQNRRLRYYDINGRDYTELLETLDLGQYKNTEVSTRKFLLDYPALMDKYDLHDEYEIHNLLKKIHAESENPQLVFGRMPFIKFGQFDREQAVRDLLFAMAPVSVDDLAKTISQSYGALEGSIKANWFDCISEYYDKGIYSIAYEDMPAEQMDLLKAELTNDFYYFSELRSIYTRLVPEADLSLLSTYNLKRMGFTVGNDYAVQNHESVASFFRFLLTEQDIFSTEPFDRKYASVQMYGQTLADLKKDLTLIEFEPKQFINRRRLESHGYGIERLRLFGDQVWNFLSDDHYFTISSLRNKGFVSDLDVLGFVDLFYASLLKEDNRFSSQQIGRTTVFNPKATSFSVRMFLEECILRHESIDITQFVAELNSVYDIGYDKSKVISKIRDSEMFYDPIMEKLYMDYDTYFAEI